MQFERKCRLKVDGRETRILFLKSVWVKFKKSRKLETLTLKGYYGWSFISCEFFFNSIVPKGHKSFISFLEPVGKI